MKKLKWIITLLIVSLVIGVIGCKDPEVEHQHQFTKKWEIDEYYHWKKCNCGEIDFESEHSFGDWQVIKAATEEAEGKQERKCTVCPYKATEVIEKLAHTHKFATDWTKDETNHWHVSTCGHEVTDGKATHTFGDWTVTKAATEEAEGTKERSCTVCGYTATEVIEKLAHTHKFATDWTQDGTYHWHAAICEHTTEVSEKAAHSFGDWTITKAATEEAEGSKERSCTVCGYTATKVIAKLAHPHKFATDWTKDGTYHWHAATCGHDVTDSKAEHSFVNEVCTICEYSRIPEGFVLIPAGTFQMGSEDGYDDNKPVHQVTITKSFYMGKYEVTQAEYEKYCSYGSCSPSSSYGDGDNYPAYYVSWYDALVYCNKRSMAEGLTPCYSIKGSTNPKDWGTVPTSRNEIWDAVICNWNANGYRLPTEAEWEYAARAGDNTVDNFTYSGTSDVNKLGEYAWYKDNSNSTTHEVGTKLQNAYGLYDMSGNVREWCWNWYTDSYDTGKEGDRDPTGSSAGSYRVYRGGGWSGISDGCAVSYRDYYDPNLHYSNLGFRVVRASSN